MTTKVAINGFGRIGRNVFRAALESNADVEFVAVNDITDSKTLAHLLKYDSIYGILEGDVDFDENSISLDGEKVRVFAERDPGSIPWGDLGAQIVVESTGLFADREKAAAHLGDSVQKVIISAPAKGPDLTVCLGVQ